MIKKLDCFANKKDKKISYKDDSGAALQYSKKDFAETDTIHISRAAKIIRNDIFQKEQEFKGKITKNPSE